MAGKAGRSADDAERMPLGEHIRELRNRLMKAALAILIGGILGFVFRTHVLHALETPVCSIKGLHGVAQASKQCPNGAIVFSGPTAQVSLSFKIAMYVGIVLASPVWLYQVWAFLAPGLYKKEKKYSLAFIGAAVPLFVAGVTVCYFLFPLIMQVLLSFLSGAGGATLLDASQYMTFILQMMTVFGVSFVLPLVLVLFNFIGIMSSKAMRKWWRGIVLAIFIFAAIAVPTGDPIGMSVLAIPICLLYFAAVGIAELNDRRRTRRKAAMPGANLSPDEATDLDLSPAPIEDSQSLEDIL
ncbi:twin-arginine translocase subunit TatC [Actinospica sp.]|uniref:twin-arginine translocase subunit TatC n=1 Tax=Actinospica sp. TaxID=1872142 RepID=UPI002BA7BE56|nr:twin-arginine translocase subunit TatC [Actinospica sp.]HWG28157.1 twin-arginine translocase subunit TatC [Actinospica sp.]